MTDDIETLSLSDQVVLLTVTHLSQADETPAHTGEVIRACNDLLADVEVDTLGSVSEAEINRALNRLEDQGLVQMAEGDDTSPIGKGRPAYSLTVDESRVTDVLSDDRVGPIVDQLD